MAAVRSIQSVHSVSTPLATTLARHGWHPRSPTLPLKNQLQLYQRYGGVSSSLEPPEEARNSPSLDDPSVLEAWLTFQQICSEGLPGLPTPREGLPHEVDWRKYLHPTPPLASPTMAVAAEATTNLFMPWRCKAACK